MVFTKLADKTKSVLSYNKLKKVLTEKSTGPQFHNILSTKYH